ncbi:MAG: barstar family protein [Aristaeellaceae bacterium]
MQTIFIDGAQYADGQALHRGLQRLLALPAWYGCNADALHDCLAGRGEPLRVVILSPGTGDTASALGKCVRVMRNMGISVINCTERIDTAAP